VKWIYICIYVCVCVCVCYSDELRTADIHTDYMTYLNLYTAALCCTQLPRTLNLEITNFLPGCVPPAKFTFTV
jgi:hypothetical protein